MIVGVSIGDGVAVGIDLLGQTAFGIKIVLSPAATGEPKAAVQVSWSTDPRRNRSRYRKVPSAFLTNCLDPPGKVMVATLSMSCSVSQVTIMAVRYILSTVSPA